MPDQINVKRYRSRFQIDYMLKCTAVAEITSQRLPSSPTTPLFFSIHPPKHSLLRSTVNCAPHADFGGDCAPCRMAGWRQSVHWWQRRHSTPHRSSLRASHRQQRTAPATKAPLRATTTSRVSMRLRTDHLLFVVDAHECNFEIDIPFGLAWLICSTPNHSSLGQRCCSSVIDPQVSWPSVSC